MWFKRARAHRLACTYETSGRKRKSGNHTTRARAHASGVNKIKIGMEQPQLSTQCCPAGTTDAKTVWAIAALQARARRPNTPRYAVNQSKWRCWRSEELLLGACDCSYSCSDQRWTSAKYSAPAAAPRPPCWRRGRWQCPAVADRSDRSLTCVKNLYVQNFSKLLDLFSKSKKSLSLIIVKKT